MYQSLIAARKNKRSNKTRKREFIYPDDDQRFAVVKDLLGNGRTNALCEDGQIRLARIRGSMRKGPKKAIVTKGDLVIVSNRDFENKVDLVHKYTHEEATLIFRQYQLPDMLRKAFNNDISSTVDEGDDIEFGDNEDDDNRSEGEGKNKDDSYDIDIDDI
jgi:translation initiation factor 1A